jgi:hypothetical protein
LIVYKGAHEEEDVAGDVAADMAAPNSRRTLRCLGCRLTCGRLARTRAMASSRLSPRCCMRKATTTTVLRPRPALQCTYVVFC